MAKTGIAPEQYQTLTRLAVELEGTYCVLALRRLTEMQRIVPFQSNAIDMLMRNCTRGTEEEALKPATPAQVSYPTIGRNVPTSPQTLSPLAAPLP